MPNNELSVSRESLNPLYRNVFDSPENGSPNDIGKKGCLALARLGAASWNAWRKDFPASGGKLHLGYGVTSQYANTVDFANHVFNEFADFSHFNFGSNANFENAEFKKQAIFDHAIFGEDTNFDLVKFQSGAQLQNAKFENGVHFRCAKFTKLAFFSHALFGGQVDFTGARFSGQASFDKVVFGRELIFDQAHFDCLVINFKGASWEGFFSVYPPEEIDSIKLWATKRDLHPGKISCASFGGATFTGTVDFSGIEFVGKTRFSKSFVDGNIFWPEREESGQVKFTGGKAKKLASFELELGIPLVFGSPPIFHNCKFNQDVSFDGAEFPNSSGHESSIRAYRTLKLAFAQMQAVREEQQFFRLEMAEEHKAIKGSGRWLHSAYALLSDYGFSTLRPFLLLMFTLLAALVGYGLLAEYSICVPFLSNCSLSKDWFEFGLINAVPLPGLDKYAEDIRAKLFVLNLHPASQLMITAIVILQKSFSILAFFLIGLALRNSFKMK